MKSLRNFLYERPIISVLIIIVVDLLLVQYPIRTSFSGTLLFNVFREIFPVALTLFFIYLVTGKAEIEFSSKGFGFALRKGWYVFVIAFLTGGVYFLAVFYGKHLIFGNAILTFLECLIFGILIGLFEEGLFRGLFLNALLVKYGKTTKDILKAVIISSILFGFVHTLPSIIENLTNPSAYTFSFFGQIIGKTLQTGILGFLLGAIYLKNHNLWSIALLHGFNDFSMFLPGYLYNTIQLGNYVDPTTFVYVYVYFGLSIISIPMVVIGYRIIKNLSVPQPGFFKVCWFPIDVKK